MKKWYHFFVKLLLISLILLGSGRETRLQPITPVFTPQIEQRLIGVTSMPSMQYLKPNPDKNIVIYLNPHADDEVLTFGVPIRNDLSQGKQVYVLLLSEGESSIARDVVNGFFDHESYHVYTAGKRQWCGLHQRIHNPSAEGYTPLSLKTFGEARVREFRRASTELGVPKQNLFVYQLANGHFDSQLLTMIIRDWVKFFPNATFVTMSEKDVHKDHAKTGKVLNRLYQQRVVKYKENIASIATKMRYPNLNKRSSSILLQKRDRIYLEKAIGVYRLWEPQTGYFALGYHSVSLQFEYLKKHMDQIMLPN